MRDNVTENKLKAGQFKNTYQNVEFSDIDIKASLENPMRLDRKLDDERAFQYGLDYEKGDLFPALLLLNHPDPQSKYKWIVASGMHRLTGAQLAKLTSHDAYCVVEADNYRREVLCRMANVWVGFGCSYSEQITHILQLHKKYNKPLATLCKEWSVKLSSVTDRASQDRACERSRQIGWDFERHKVPMKMAASVGSISLDSVFAVAAEFVCSVPGVTTSEIRDMVAEIKKAASEKVQLEIITRYRAEAEDKLKRAKARTGRIPTAVNRIMADVRRINNRFDMPMDELYVAALIDPASARLQVREAIENLKRFDVELERVQKMSVRPGYRSGAARSPDRPEAHP